jgi:hypothetical protein
MEDLFFALEAPHVEPLPSRMTTRYAMKRNMRRETLQEIKRAVYRIVVTSSTRRQMGFNYVVGRLPADYAVSSITTAVWELVDEGKLQVYYIADTPFFCRPRQANIQLPETEELSESDAS